MDDKVEGYTAEALYSAEAVQQLRDRLKRLAGAVRAFVPDWASWMAEHPADSPVTFYSGRARTIGGLKLANELIEEALNAG